MHALQRLSRTGHNSSKEQEAQLKMRSRLRMNVIKQVGELKSLRSRQKQLLLTRAYSVLHRVARVRVGAHNHMKEWRPTRRKLQPTTNHPRRWHDGSLTDEPINCVALQQPNTCTVKLTHVWPSKESGCRTVSAVCLAPAATSRKYNQAKGQECRQVELPA